MNGPLQPPPLPGSDAKILRIVLALVVSIALAIAGLATWTLAAAREHLRARPPQTDRAAFPELSSAGPDRLYDAAFGLCSSGRQVEAEALLDAGLARHPRDPGLLFFRGVLFRSRFREREASAVFERLLREDGDSPRAEAARLAIELDRHEYVDHDLAELTRLAADPSEPLILWLLAIECREHDRGDEGEAAFRRLAPHFTEGPALFHQTFGNILMEEQGKQEEALAHYCASVEQEPKGWNYQAMGLCLEKLGRHEEAADAYAGAVSNAPGKASYWNDWGAALVRAGRYDEGIPKIKKAHELDPELALYVSSLGWALGSAGREKEAFEQYQLAADMGNAMAKANLAYAYLWGLGCETNYLEARLWAERAIAQREEAGYSHLGRIYLEGLGVPTNATRGLMYLEKGANAGDVKSMNDLCWRLASGKGIPRDQERARLLRERSAGSGDSWAIRDLARTLAYGADGVSNDVPRAIALYEKLHAKGYRKEEIAADLGYCYWRASPAGPPDFVKSVKFYEEGAEGGVSWAYRDLGRIFSAGRNVTQDCARAVEYFVKQGGADGLNSAAWTLATATNAAAWDGPRAVEYARKALETSPDDPSLQDTLAAAYARAGQFEKAAEIERAVVKGIEQRQRKEEMEWLPTMKERVAEYEAGRAWVEPVK